MTYISRDNETRLLNERLERLKTFVDMNAPVSVIGVECELVLRSLHNNSKWELIFSLIRSAIHDSWHYRVAWPVLLFLCKSNIYHHKDDDGDCYFCGFYKELGWH